MNKFDITKSVGESFEEAIKIDYRYEVYHDKEELQRIEVVLESLRNCVNSLIVFSEDTEKESAGSVSALNEEVLKTLKWLNTQTTSHMKYLEEE